MINDKKHTVFNIANRLELFTDHALINRMDGVNFKLHHPHEAQIALSFDKPWEGNACGYCTVLYDGDKYRLYYRGWHLEPKQKDDDILPVYCLAYSDDGVHFERPDLGIVDRDGNKDNNIFMEGRFCHAFSPFIDKREGVPANEKYKALATSHDSGKHTLWAFCSPDGINWKAMQERPVCTQGEFDSQNVAFWSEHENCYVCYGRTWSNSGGENLYKGKRTISRFTSSDFINWSSPRPMQFGGTPLEELYTSQTVCYPRAPHIYISLPKRFVPDRTVLTKEQAEQLNVHPSQRSGVSDGVFMTSRGGNIYDRLFMEAFVRPGAELGNWAARSHMAAWGIATTGERELSLYYSHNYCQPAHHLRRYKLRTDGFVSINAPWRGGEMVTKPLLFSGEQLIMNIATSAAGSVRVELQNAAGVAVPGFSLDDAIDYGGDEIATPIHWRGGSNLNSLIGKPIRIRVVMKDSDLYSLQFAKTK